MGKKDSGLLQLGDVVMGECSPGEAPAFNRHALQPEHRRVLRMSYDSQFEHRLRQQLRRWTDLVRGRARVSADQWVIEELLDLLAGGPQIMDIRQFRDPLFPAIRTLSPRQEVRRREPQHDTGLKQIGLGGVLQDIELLLRQVAFYFKQRPDTHGDKVNVKSSWRRRVLFDLNGTPMNRLQSRCVLAVKGFFKLLGTGGAALEPRAVNLDESLQWIEMEASRFEHQTVMDERGESTQTRFHALGTVKARDHHVAQVIEPHFETHFAGALSWSLCGRARGRRRRRR